MGQTRKELKARFAPYPLPELLGSLADYWDKHSVFFSGSFEVSIDEYDMLDAWFRGSKEGTSRIRIFGHDGVGSLVGMWFYEGLKASEGPVIFLGGEGNTILSDNMAGYLSILAANRDWEPLDGAFMEPEESNAAENEHFKSWLFKQHGIKPAKDPMKVLKAAQKNHPNFGKWLSSVRPIAG